MPQPVMLKKLKQFYEDLQALLELIPKKRCPFHIGDWNAKLGSQETPGMTGKFGLGIRNEAGQRLIEFCQENALEWVNLTQMTIMSTTVGRNPLEEME